MQLGVAKYYAKTTYTTPRGYNMDMYIFTATELPSMSDGKHPD